jgi:hypothetical protein
LISKTKFLVSCGYRDTANFRPWFIHISQHLQVHRDVTCYLGTRSLREELWTKISSRNWKIPIPKRADQTSVQQGIMTTNSAIYMM